MKTLKNISRETALTNYGSEVVLLAEKNFIRDNKESLFHFDRDQETIKKYLRQAYLELSRRKVTNENQS